MENIRDILRLLDMAIEDAIDYGAENKTKLINSNLIAVGAEAWSVSFSSDTISIDFILYQHHYQRQYAVNN